MTAGKRTDPVGTLRERIRIATLAIERDGLLGTSKVWTESELIKAEVIYSATGTDEMYSSAQKTVDAKVDFRIRFREVSTTSEVVYRGKRYRIEGVIPNAFRSYVTLETRQIQENYDG